MAQPIRIAGAAVDGSDQETLKSVSAIYQYVLTLRREIRQELGTATRSGRPLPTRPAAIDRPDHDRRPSSASGTGTAASPRHGFSF